MPTPEELIRAGAHIGHVKSKWNPKMSPYVFGVRNNFHVIDVFQTVEKLKEAIEFLKEIIRGGGSILFVGTKTQTREMVLETANSLGMPYIVGRWIGGLFTNFKVVKNKIKYFIDLESKKESGEFEKYTKKEKLGFERELKKLGVELGGIKNMEKLPAAIFVCDVEKEKTAILEARKMNIPVVAIVDTDGDPTIVDKPIPSNDSAVSALRIIFSAIIDELKNIKPLEVPVTKEGSTKEEATEKKGTSIASKKDDKKEKASGRQIIASREALKGK